MQTRSKTRALNVKPESVKSEPVKSESGNKSAELHTTVSSIRFTSPKDLDEKFAFRAYMRELQYKLNPTINAAIDDPTSIIGLALVLRDSDPFVGTNLNRYAFKQYTDILSQNSRHYGILTNPPFTFILYMVSVIYMLTHTTIYFRDQILEDWKKFVCSIDTDKFDIKNQMLYKFYMYNAHQLKTVAEQRLSTQNEQQKNMPVRELSTTISAYLIEHEQLKNAKSTVDAFLDDQLNEFLESTTGIYSKRPIVQQAPHDTPRDSGNGGMRKGMMEHY